MRQLKIFNTYGMDYRVMQFAAAEAFAFWDRLDTLSPIEMLQLTEVRSEGNTWEPLSEPQNINAYVRDVTGMLRPQQALTNLMNLVRQENFGFKVQKVKIPKRFMSGTPARVLEGTHPIQARLITEKLAILRELQEYYTLEDAFKMYCLG